jgi:hypothetical protein
VSRRVFSVGHYTMDFRRQVFCMDTAQAYGKMQEANRIIEDFPIGKYALYAILYLAEIALCFTIIRFI